MIFGVLCISFFYLLGINTSFECLSKLEERGFRIYKKLKTMDPSCHHQGHCQWVLAEGP